MYVGVQGCTLAYVNINLHLPDDLSARIDEARGKVPRSVWIRDAVEMRLSPTAVSASPPQPPKARRAPEALADEPELLPKPKPRKKKALPLTDDLKPKVAPGTHPFKAQKGRPFLCECGQKMSARVHD